jgi:hypothetical protein
MEAAVTVSDQALLNFIFAMVIHEPSISEDRNVPATNEVERCG